MSIGSNMNMAMMTKDYGVSSVEGAVGSVGIYKNGVSGMMGESPFKKLIAKALENSSIKADPQNTAKTDATADPTAAADQETDPIGRMFAALAGNAGQTKLKIQTQSDDSAEDTVLSALSQDEADKKGQTPDSLATLLAMFNGTFNATQITTDDSSGTTETELTAADLASLLESVQPGKNGISGLLNRREQMMGLTENVGNSGKDDPVKLLSQNLDENGTLTVLAEIGGKQIQFTGMMKNTDSAPEPIAASAVVETSDDSLAAVTTSTETNATGQGITLKELMTMLKHTGEKSSAPGLGQLESKQLRMRPDHQEAGAEIHGKNTAETDTVESGMVTDTADTADAKVDRTVLTGSSDNKSDPIDESLNAAAYQSQMNAAATSDTGSASLASKPTDVANAYSQVSDQILTTLEKKGPTEFKMQLQPENLGQIDISLKISEGKLMIDIAADKAQTQTLLTGQVDKLISSLGLQNVQVESVQVTQQMNSDSQNSQNQSYQHQNSGMNFSNGRQNSGDTGQSWQQFTGGSFGSQRSFSPDDVLEASDLTDYSFGRMNYKI